jgi:MFS family permease
MRLACRVGGWIEDPASSIQHLLPKKLYPQCKLNAEDSVSTLEGRVASYRSPELQAIFGVTLMAVLGVSSIAPALPRIAATLGVSAGQVGLLVTAFTLPASPGITAGPLRVRDRRRGLCIRNESARVDRAQGGAGDRSIGDRFDQCDLDRRSLRRSSAHGRHGPQRQCARLHVAPKGHKADLNDYFGDLWVIVRRREVVALFFASTAIFILLYGAYITFLPFLMSGRFGSTPLGIGLLMAGLSISTAVTSASLGRLAARLGEVMVMRVGFVVFAVGLALVPLAPVVWALAVPAVLLGFSFATTIPVVQVLLTAIAPVDRRGAVMSLNGTVLRLGQTLGPPVMAVVYRVAGIDAVFFAGAVFALFLAALMTWAVRE